MIRKDHFRYSIQALLMLGMSSLSFCTTQPPSGWHLYNATEQPVGLAWYETDIIEEIESSRLNPLNLLFSSGKKEVPTGPKRRASQPIIIAPLSSYFLAKETTETNGRYQLLVTQSPFLLKPWIDADTKGKQSLPGMYVFDSSTHSFLGEDPNERLLSVSRSIGSYTLSLSQGAELGTFGSETRDSKKGWTIQNNTHKRLYAGWYVKFWNDTLNAFETPTRSAYQHTIIVEPRRNFILPIPPAPEPNPSSADHQNVLLLSFDYLPDTPPMNGIFTSTKEDLKGHETEWHVYSLEGAPHMVPFSNLIHLINTTNKKLYGAFYYVGPSGALKYGPPDLITPLEPHLQVDFAYPPNRAGYDVCLFLAYEGVQHLLNEQILSNEQITPLSVKSFSKTNVFNWYAHRTFAVETNWNDPHHIHITSVGSGAFEYLARKLVDVYPVPYATISLYEQKFKEQAPDYLPDIDILKAQRKPSVLLKSADKVQEKSYLLKRSEKVRKALNKVLGNEYLAPGDKIPTIALVFTGGGYRAMIETIGFLQGAADDEGGSLLDCCTYMMGLSGSTWALMPLVASGLNPDEFAARQRTCVGKGGRFTLQTLISNLNSESEAYQEKRFIQSRYGQFHGPIGLYGHALAHALLEGITLNGKEKHSITLSDLRTNLENAQYPLPLSVAIDPGNQDEQRIWYEFSPYYIGTKQEKGGWIDTKLGGSIFHHGEPVHCVPEYPLAYYMGIWGSAFAITPQDLAKESMIGGAIAQACISISDGLTRAYNFFMQKPSDDPLYTARFTSGTLPNYNYKRTTAHDGVSLKPLLTLVDGGIAKEGSFRHNFATIPALWRKADILIMCDCTYNPNSDDSAEHLRAADEEARRQRLAFPNITRSTRHRKTLDTLNKNVASLFVEKKAPLVVYIKAKRNSLYDETLTQSQRAPHGFDPDAKVNGFTATSNFSYTPEQFDLLSGLTRSLFIQSKNTIKEAICITLTTNR